MRMQAQQSCPDLSIARQPLTVNAATEHKGAIYRGTSDTSDQHFHLSILQHCSKTQMSHSCNFHAVPSHYWRVIIENKNKGPAILWQRDSCTSITPHNRASLKQKAITSQLASLPNGPLAMQVAYQ